ALCEDIEKRFEAMRAAREKALPGREHIAPGGAFYACVRLCEAGDERGVQEFLQAIARHRKVDVTWAGKGFVRVSLGGNLQGDDKSYQRFAKALEVYLALLAKYWENFEAGGRDVGQLDALFGDLSALLADLQPLLELHPAQKKAIASP